MASGMIIDGVFASEAIDSSGEILDIKGCDISDLENGLGVLNWEHRGDDAAGASANDIIGKVVFAKKIYGPEDCTDERQLGYWQQVQLPMIYGICRLFDGSGHPGAIAAAAMIRDYQKNGEPLLIRYSIEGTTLSKDKGTNRLLESVARRIAATIKPCNKSCHSGLISDPNDPSVRKKEHAHPNFTPLGGSFEIEAAPVVDNPELIRKALAAGSYNAAPGTLTGGSALQVEDQGLRNRVKAAVRDWDRVTPFKKFLKHRLPEASDTFIDRFSNLVGDYTIKKAQRQVLKDALVKKATEKLKQKMAKPKAPAADVSVDDSGDKLTIRGKPVKTNPQITRPHFDERKGVLHTQRGSFPIYIPSRDKETPDAGQKFHNIMNDPKVNKFHDYAMENWAKMHERLKNGTMPPEAIMHGVLFSQLSPNTPVPMQELMYSHLVDSMKATGADPRVPGSFGDSLKADWLDRDQPQRWPEHSREHFRRLEDQLRLKRDSVERAPGDQHGPSVRAPRKEGDIGRFMLASNKFKNMSRYHELHNSLVDLVGRHRHDSRSAVEELMHHKVQAGLWEARRKREQDKGRPDIGPYTGGPDVPGLAPKTARYTMGMLGGGNVMVPDTHFARYLFGLDRDKDAKTIQYLRNQVLWNENNSHILGGIDRYYGKNHDAVQHMLQHPKWGPVFQSPEDAIFPAFWKNWVGIIPHEAARGMKTHGWNEATDHRPFWEAVDPYLNKSEDAQPDDPLEVAKQTARTHAEWVAKYGEMPAMLMYFHFLVPKLLEGTEKREKQQQVVKFENQLIEMNELRKDEGKGLPGDKPMADWKNPPTVKFNGKDTKVGRAWMHGDESKQLALLDQNQSHFIGVPWEKLGAHQPEDLVKIPRHAGYHGFAVVEPPSHVSESQIVHHQQHSVGEFVHHPETQALVHGFDLGQEKLAPERKSSMSAHSFWARSPNGQRVFVKQDADEQNNPFRLETARREGLFHNLAKDFFGLGDFVTPTAVIHHPQSGKEMAVVQHVDGSHMFEDLSGYKRAAKEMEASGDLHKLALMDYITHNGDRNGMNFIVSPDRKFKLIDNGRAFDYNLGPPMKPTYLEKIFQPVHPEAAKWLSGLNPTNLEMEMRRHGAPDVMVSKASGRLKSVQQYVKKNPQAPISDVIRSEWL